MFYSLLIVILMHQTQSRRQREEDDNQSVRVTRHERDDEFVYFNREETPTALKGEAILAPRNPNRYCVRNPPSFGNDPAKPRVVPGLTVENAPLECVFILPYLRNDAPNDAPDRFRYYGKRI